MNLLRKSMAAAAVLLFSSAAIAQDAEREYLLSLYHAISLEAEQLAAPLQTQNHEEASLTTEAQTPVIEISFPVADNTIR